VVGPDSYTRGATGGVLHELTSSFHPFVRTHFLGIGASGAASDGHAWNHARAGGQCGSHFNGCNCVHVHGARLRTAEPTGDSS
jgi:hypothetical protein